MDDLFAMDEAEFLAFMTFASGGGGGCPCCDGDECGTSSTTADERASAAATVPVDANLRKREAEEPVDANLRKRQREAEEPSVFEGSKQLHIRQHRELVKREDGFSMWRMELPPGGDPIVEYRSNHRIVFVKQLSKAARLSSIGQGAIGSPAEESGRRRVRWKEGAAYFLPCTVGIACGWIHDPGDEADTEGDGGDAARGASSSGSLPPTDIVLYSLKVAPETLRNMAETPPDDAACWVTKSRALFRRCLAKTQHQTGENGDGAIEDVELSDEESMTMNLITELVQ